MGEPETIDVTPEIPGIDTASKASPEQVDQVDPKRKIYVDSRALVELYAGDRIVARFRPPKHIGSIVESLEGLDADAVVSVYIVEDEKTSDPPPEGTARLKIPVFDIEKAKASDAIARLKDSVYTPETVLTEFQKLCDYATFRSDLVGVNVTFVYQGGESSGFSFFTSATKVNGMHMVGMYNAARDQLDKYREKMRETHPDVKFPDDNDIGQQLMSAPIGDSGQQVPDGLKQLSQNLGGIPVTVTK